MIELTCKKCDDVTILCDEGVTAVTCSLCSMLDVITELGKLSDEEVEALANTEMGVA